MYLVNTRPDMLCSECTQLDSESSKTNTLDCNEGSVEISMNQSWLWPKICLQCRNEIAGICRCKLGKERSGLEENPWLLFYFGIFHGFLVQ
jgi:hypothetical protein